MKTRFTEQPTVKARAQGFKNGCLHTYTQIYGDILTEYSAWLMREGYLDIDWMGEGQDETTVIKYLKTL